MRWLRKNRKTRLLPVKNVKIHQISMVFGGQFSTIGLSKPLSPPTPLPVPLAEPLCGCAEMEVEGNIYVGKPGFYWEICGILSVNFTL
jgi:hypothetical protein